jgi:hypothetical protein
MDGKGRFLDNIFIERLWRSLKYEEIFIRAYSTVSEARKGINDWILFYNDERPHQALDYRTPRAVFEVPEGCGYVDNAGALTTYPQETHYKSLILSEEGFRSNSLTGALQAASAGTPETGGTLS